MRGREREREKHGMCSVSRYVPRYLGSYAVRTVQEGSLRSPEFGFPAEI